MSDAIIQTGMSASAPVYYFGFLGNVTSGATVFINNTPGFNGPNTSNTTPTNTVSQLVGAMASYGASPCCCVASTAVTSGDSAVLLASVY